MKKLLLVLAAGSLILGACSDAASSVKTDTSVEDASKTEPKQEEEKTKKEEPKKEEPPFKALEPSKEAVLMQKTLLKEKEKQMPEDEGQTEGQEQTKPESDTLADGIEDFSDGPLKNHRLVTYYGTPQSEHMGILGKYEPEEFMKKLKEQTQAYSDADPDRPAVPTIELITTMAQSDPGPDGDYVSMTSEKNIENYVNLAKKHDALVILDIQLGKDTVMNQVKMVEKWLKLPNVHLAIDTEFHVTDGEKPGEDLGEVDGTKIQEAIEYISQLTEKNNLPDKLVLVHQFTGPVLTNKDAIKPTENVEVAINFDGWGASADKQALYKKFIHNEPNQYGGFKIFYEKDVPVLTPEEVLKMEPSPAIVNYQ
ncbi:hypothetical protein LCM10_03995 [Rossellomorea aquimaris]|uniref:hypothetical protein n=1 Tax=Rossellomorea aquimaris TaxID=189382 RepID=UPI001CD3E45D|nr:hypothetical protein [Rossellomorea aquimaris]MCA1054138.1 hypothetical protein [Rossellomorea aquimaris]